MIDAVIGDIVSAIPTVSGMKHTTMYAYGLCTPSWASNKNANEMLNMPKPTVRCAPNRALSRGVNGATKIMITAIGNVRSDASSGLYPCTSWKYCVIMNSTPYIDRNTRIIPPVPVLNAGFLK